jgi:DNA-binding NtrC family response regulator
MIPNGWRVVASKHVLVVDDDPSILDLMSRVLEGEELRVSTARRVSLARDVMARQKIDLIITDARIPGETGLRLADTARDLGIAYILMSGDPEWAAEHGVAPHQYLAKPFDLRELLRLVHARLALGAAEPPPA